MRRRKLTVKVNPAEIVDAHFKARAGGVPLASARKTYVTAGQRKLVLKVSRAAVRSLKARVAELRAAGRRLLTLSVSAALVDIAGNTATSHGGLRLRLPGPRQPPSGPKGR